VQVWVTETGTEAEAGADAVGQGFGSPGPDGKLNPRVGLPLDLSFYNRQYLGLFSGGRRIVYINAFPAVPDGRALKARTQFVDECEGGFWGIKYDTGSKSFLNFAVNRTECKVLPNLTP
jgi:hypothetical protein